MRRFRQLKADVFIGIFQGTKLPAGVQEAIKIPKIYAGILVSLLVISGLSCNPLEFFALVGSSGA
jgi:hypothetical protein